VSYIYLKKTPSPTLRLPHTQATWSLNVKSKKIIASIFFIFGVFLFSSAVFPILQFQLEYSSKFGQILNPLSYKYYNNSGSILGDLTASDYTQLSNWFETNSHTDSDPALSQVLSNVSQASYKISIPILKISNAVVEVGSLDLKKSLIQWPQTALPGQLGNGVVFGHSVLPQFFNPSSYLTIFSTLYRLKIGNEIFIDYDNIRYKYLVDEMFEVTPTDLSVLEQRFDGRYFTLITCSPPGTYLRRLVVRTRIADNNL
jgi:sortase A